MRTDYMFQLKEKDRQTEEKIGNQLHTFTRDISQRKGHKKVERKGRAKIYHANTNPKKSQHGQISSRQNRSTSRQKKEKTKTLLNNNISYQYKI